MNRIARRAGYVWKYSPSALNSNLFDSKITYFNQRRIIGAKQAQLLTSQETRALKKSP